MALHTLSARQVQAAGIGKHSDGGGLFLTVSQRGASWVYKFTSPSGRRREMGCGPAERNTLAAAGASLSLARKVASKAREQIASGADPLDERMAARTSAKAKEAASKAEVKAEYWTLARCARDYHARVIERTRSAKHSVQWLQSLENHIPAHLWHASIDKIEPPQLFEALSNIKPHERARNLTSDHRLAETVRRLRQRIDAVCEDAQFHRRASSNPAAAIKRKLTEAMGKKVAGNFASLDYREIPDFVRALRSQSGTAAMAFEMLLLTASRTSEILGARWGEFDIATATWHVPPARMKTREEHLVPLAPRILVLLERARELQPSPWVFPNPADSERPLSNGALLALLGRMGMRNRTTTHGMRATFCSWSNEAFGARADVVEAALAHREADLVRRAYLRAQFHSERRRLLLEWSRFCSGEQVQPASERPSASVHALPIAA